MIGFDTIFDMVEDVPKTHRQAKNPARRHVKHTCTALIIHTTRFYLFIILFHGSRLSQGRESIRSSAETEIPFKKNLWSLKPLLN